MIFPIRLRQQSNTNEKTDVKCDMSDMDKLIVEITNMRKELDEMKEIHKNKIDGIWSCIFIIYGLLILSTIKKH